MYLCDMCGICGLYSPGGVSKETLSNALKRMNSPLRHRGPDGKGLWVDPKAGLGFGHRRLAIIDLSPTGAQPMTSPNGRYTITYNGEIYNYREIQEVLITLGHGFTGQSDTEVLLASIAQWGVEQALARCIGMFAFALWDKQEQTLTLARDRMGIKPLYYGWAGSTFLFGSELKAICAYPDFEASLDRNALSTYFRFNYIPAEHTIYSNAKKLRPGSLLTLQQGHAPSTTQYWDIRNSWAQGTDTPFQGDENEALTELESLLKDSVEKRLVADVPVGCFLSGGIDSSLVTSLMQSVSTSPTKTFTIGFDDPKLNEAHHAQEIANHLGTKHTEMHITHEAMKHTLPELPKYWDEPFADASQIPTYCLSHLTRKHVTVCLSGDGGDELFYGYDRYFITKSLWEKLRFIPTPIRRLLTSSGKRLPFSFFQMLGEIGPKIYWRLDGLKCQSLDELYLFLLSHNKQPDSFVINGREYETEYSSLPIGTDPIRQMAQADALTYLPDDILTKVDRASMSASLETRLPLLDHRVVEFAATLPTSYKVQNGKGKHLLRRLLEKHIPKPLFERPKKGFGVPMDKWLREDLRDWCEAMLDIQQIEDEGYLNATAVNTMWTEFLEGRPHWQHHLWDVLMFQAWLKESR